MQVLTDHGKIKPVRGSELQVYMGHVLPTSGTGPSGETNQCSAACVKAVPTRFPC